MNKVLRQSSNAGTVIPVILCGGIGTRLWPLSRPHAPKQFLAAGGDGAPSFFQDTVRRHAGPLYAAPIVVTSERNAAQARRQLTEIQALGEMICEPVARNTGPAVIAAALRALAEDPAALLLVVPSDHVITGDLDRVVRAARPAAMAGRIVMIGITPEHPETGYGYILDGGPGAHGLRRVARFVEKPARPVAQALIASGAAYWASGLSLFRADTIVTEFRRFAPETLGAVEAAVARARHGPEGLILDRGTFRRAAASPTERLVFERSDRLLYVPAALRWSDVGSWAAMYDVAPKDEHGNALQGDVVAVDTERAFVRAEDRLVAVVGMSDVVVVETSDAVLVTRRGACQGVKSVVERLSAETGKARATNRTEHAWGDSRQVHLSPACDLSVLRLKPGASIRVPAVPGRVAVVAGGAVEVFDGVHRRLIEPGATVALDVEGSGRMENVGADPAEVLLVSRTDAGPVAAHA